MDGRRWRAHLVYTGGVVASALTPMLERRIGRRWPQAGKAVVPAILAASAVGAEVLERRRPERRGWQPDPDDLGRDVGYLGFLATAGAVPALADALVSRGGAPSTDDDPGRRRGLGVHRLPTVAGVVVAGLAYDFFHYWWHRISHQWGPAWTVHVVHHQPTKMYWRLGVHQHVIEFLFDGVGAELIYRGLGLSRAQRSAVTVLRTTIGSAQHLNSDLDTSGWMDRVFSTNTSHRWHHSQDYREGDTNYSSFLAFWDHVFGTYFVPDRDFDSEIGVGRMPNFPTVVRELQMVPFRWAEVREANADTWYVDTDAPTEFHTPAAR